MIKRISGNLLHYLADPKSRSIGIIFMVNALVFSTWAVRIPEIKAFLNISDAQLGLALLAAPLGVIVFAPLTTLGINKLGAGRMTILAGLFMPITLIGLGLPQHYYQLCIALFLFGLSNGTLDISMNAVASAVEKEQKRVIMSTTHGFWSLGAMIFSLIAGLVAGLHIGYFEHFVGACVLAFAVVIMVRHHLLPIIDHQEEHFKWTWPNRSLLFLIVIAFIVFMSEGIVMDWNAIFYTDILNAPAAQVGLGFTAFSGAMAVARFSGDVFIEKYPVHRILKVAILMCVAGLLVYAMALSILINTLAMLLCGLGFSILIPVLFREAAMTKGYAPSMALAMVSTLGYMGFLVGPPLMGFVSEVSNLSVGFGIVGMVMGVMAPLLRRR